MRTQLDTGRRSRGGPLRPLVFLAVLLVAALVALAWFRTGAPRIEIQPSRPGIGRAGTAVTVQVHGPSRGLADVRVELVQDDRTTEVDKRSYPGPRPFWAFWGPRTLADSFQVVLGPQTVEGLREGEATVRVVAERPGSLLHRPAPVVAEQTLPVKLRPPLVTVLSQQHYVAQGGSGVVVYRVGKSALAEGGRDGVRVTLGKENAGQEVGADAEAPTTRFFPGHALPGGDPGERFALFAAPHDLEDPAGLRLVASDALGNEAQVAFVDQWFPRPPHQDTIRLSESFMAKVVPEIMDQTPSLEDRGSLLDNYLEINGALRAKNAAALRELAQRSAEEFLWHRPFLPLPGGEVMSSFADRRTYVFDGKPVDHQTHLGFDLASTRHAAVPAANDGVVLLARYFGIYGNTVVLDHGYGLMSLCSHLSSIAVEEGQRVERGQILGHTGATGLAGGDHLHFTMMIDGEPVTPVEWWDGSWIRDRVASKLGDAFAFENRRADRVN